MPERTYDECPHEVPLFKDELGNQVSLIKVIDPSLGCYTDKWLHTGIDRVYTHKSAMVWWSGAFQDVFDKAEGGTPNENN